MAKTLKMLAASCMFLGGMAAAYGNGTGGGVTPLEFWIDDRAYRTVNTPAILPGTAPDSTFDNLYLLGQRFGGCGPNHEERFTLDVADHAPGDPAYRGGRWNVWLVEFGQDCQDYQQALDECAGGNDITNMQQFQCALDRGLAALVGPVLKFECPVIPAPYVARR